MQGAVKAMCWVTAWTLIAAGAATVLPGFNANAGFALLERAAGCAFYFMAVYFAVEDARKGRESMTRATWQAWVAGVLVFVTGGLI